MLLPHGFLRCDKCGQRFCPTETRAQRDDDTVHYCDSCIIKLDRIIKVPKIEDGKVFCPNCNMEFVELEKLFKLKIFVVECGKCYYKIDLSTVKDTLFEDALSKVESETDNILKED